MANPGPRRIEPLAVRGGEASLIEEAPGADAASVTSAIEELGAVQPDGNGRRIAVLADVLEVGDVEGTHRRIVLALVRSRVDKVFTVGSAIRPLRRALPPERLGPHAADVTQGVYALEAALQPGDVVAIAGSLPAGIGEIASRLRTNRRMSALLLDVGTREVLYEDAADEGRYPASLVKLMTLYLVFDALERGDLALHDEVPVSAEAARRPPGSSNLRLEEGERIGAEEAIRALIVPSANDAAVAIAERIAGTEASFVGRMNAAASALGMTATTFANASGLHGSGAISTTARDMATLVLAMIDRFPGHLPYFSEREFRFRGRVLPARNRLLGTYEGLLGMKTGHTPRSGYHLVALARRDGRSVLSVVMGARSMASRDERTTRLLDLGFSHLADR
jgi:D-alanyl-D-alanine carboxypeptidase